MKIFPQFLIITFTLFVCAFASNEASAQFYEVQTQEVCWTTGSGLDSTIYRTDFSAVQTARPTFLFYWTIQTGSTTPTAVTVTGGTIQPGRCPERAIDSLEMGIAANLNSFSLAPDTIQANTVYEITISNQGVQTHNLLVDGQSVRLWPGEEYHFKEWYDEARREMRTNPQIIITQGIAGSSGNNTRVVEALKN